MANPQPDQPPTLQFRGLPRPDTNSLFTVHGVPQRVLDEAGIEQPEHYFGISGRYVVTAVLCIPGKQTFFDYLHLNDFLSAGESLTLMPDGNQYRFQTDTSAGPIDVRFVPNHNGQLGSIVIELIAEELLHAQSLAHDIIMPILSWFSYRHDVALDVAGWHTLEKETNASRFVFGVLGKSHTLDRKLNIIVNPEYRQALSSYREGLNSTNVFFQLLCFYKVVEWVRARRRLRQGEIRLLPTERMPDTLEDLGDLGPLEQQEFSRLLGKDSQSVYHSYEMTMRDAIAHLNPKKASLLADNFSDYSRCSKAVPVIRYISRRMLHNELMRDDAYRKEGLYL
jgi:hypothetical protein